MQFLSSPDSASKKELFLVLSGITASAVFVAFDAATISILLSQVVLTLGDIDLYTWVGTGIS